MKQKNISAASSDRISSLPEEIIHEILARLRSPKHVRKATVLSKTWTHIVRSYPILEFEESNFPSLEGFAAALEQLSQRTVSMESVRIKFKPNWNNSSPIYASSLDRILDLVAKFSPRVIDITSGCSIRNSIPASFFSPDSKQFLLRLNFLRLKRCNFVLYKEDAITKLGSLRVLCLDNVRFRNPQVLNSMIAGAPCLETLTLKAVGGHRENIRVEVNNPSLKFMEVEYSSGMDGLKITEAHSLEVVRLSLDHTFDLSFSLAPSLKELYIGGRSGWDLKAGCFNKIIPELPSLELLALSDYKGDGKLKIVNNKKLREIHLENMWWVYDIEIDVPGVSKLCYDGRTFRFPPPQYVPSLQFKHNQIMEQRPLKQRKIYAAPSCQIEEDRISRLPDDVIHRILTCLRSSKQVAQANVLSKRWTHLLRSYPVLEFDEDYYYYGRKEPQERFAEATLEKFSPRGGNISMEAVRVKIELCSDFYSGFLDQLLELAAGSSSLQEIDIEFGKGYDYSTYYGCYPDDDVTPYYIPVSFFLPSPTPTDCNQFLRLNVLKLTRCNLHHYRDLVTEDNDNPFSSLGRSLKVLILEKVNFPNDEVLNSIIAGASLLETLTLKHVVGRFQVRNHANLKAVYVHSCIPNNFEITGAPSLKKFVCNSSTKSVQISSTPNLEEVFIGSCLRRLGDEALNKLIEELRYLKLLTLNEFVLERQMRIINSGGHHKVFIGKRL